MVYEVTSRLFDHREMLYISDMGSRKRSEKICGSDNGLPNGEAKNWDEVEDVFWKELIKTNTTRSVVQRRCRDLAALTCCIKVFLLCLSQHSCRP